MLRRWAMKRVPSRCLTSLIRCDKLHVPGHPRADADFWTDRNGWLVVRFSSQGYAFHFEALLAGGGQVIDIELREQEFEDYIADKACEWVSEGIDESPEPHT